MLDGLAAPSHSFPNTSKSEKLDQDHSASQYSTGRTQARPTEDETLYISDQFTVGDEAYHELKMLSCDLPPLCQLKKARTALNNSVEIDRLPSLGAYRSFSDTLTVELRKTVSTCTCTH